MTPSASLSLRNDTMPALSPSPALPIVRLPPVPGAVGSFRLSSPVAFDDEAGGLKIGDFFPASPKMATLPLPPLESQHRHQHQHQNLPACQPTHRNVQQVHTDKSRRPAEPVWVPRHLLSQFRATNAFHHHLHHTKQHRNSIDGQQKPKKRKDTRTKRDYLGLKPRVGLGDAVDDDDAGMEEEEDAALLQAALEDEDVGTIEAVGQGENEEDEDVETELRVPVQKKVHSYSF